MKRKISYYFWATNRRKILDKLQEKYSRYYRGVVLDIGGRDRGRFKKPKDRVNKWIFADIKKSHHPDIILDVTDMKQLDSGSIDVVNAIELFEHVYNIDAALKECHRILKKNGTLILSIPFINPIHGDPDDYNRWTKHYWEKKLNELSMKIEVIEITGRYFTVITDMKKTFIRQLPTGFSKISQLLFYPLLDLIKRLDNSNYLRRRPKLAAYHGGYYIIVKKI